MKLFGLLAWFRGLAQDYTSWQWQPTLTAHDPNPPVILDNPATGPVATGQGAVAVGVAGSASGAKKIFGNALGTVGASGSETSKRAALGAFNSTIGLSGSSTGSEGAFRSFAGNEGIAGSASGKKNAIGLGTGRLGLSSMVVAVKAALGALSANEGVAGSASGTALIVSNDKIGRTFGTLGISGSTTGTAQLTDRIGQVFGVLGVSGSATGTAFIAAPPQIVPPLVAGGGFGFDKKRVKTEKETPKAALHHASGHARGSIGIGGSASGTKRITRIPFTRKDLREVLIQIEQRPRIPDDVTPPRIVAFGNVRGAAGVGGSASGTGLRPPPLLLAVGHARGRQFVGGYARGTAVQPKVVDQMSDEELVLIFDMLLDEEVL